MRCVELFIFLIILAVMAFGVALGYAALSVCLNLIGIPAPCGVGAFPAVFWGAFILFVVMITFQKLCGH